MRLRRPQPKGGNQLMLVNVTTQSQHTGRFMPISRPRTDQKGRGPFVPLILLFLFCIVLLNAPVASAQGLFGDGDAQRREAETALRIQQLEGQIRNLNGQIEQMGFQLRQMQDQMLKVQKDTDFRLQELENAPSPGKRPTVPPKKTEAAPVVTPGTTMNMQSGLAQAAPDRTLGTAGSAGSSQQGEPQVATAMSDDDSLLPPAAIGGPNTGPRQGPLNGQQILGAPPKVLGQISGTDETAQDLSADGPIDLGRGQQVAVAPRQPAPIVAPVPGVTPKYANVQPTPSARDEYDAAYGYILNGEYELAGQSFKTFLANHPTDRRAGSAQYWLGESYFQRNLHREATDAFLKSYTQYPDDVKAPDSLLKLGLAYQGLGERKAACNAYDELLTKYPKASKALRDRAVAEKSRGKCT